MQVRPKKSQPAHKMPGGQPTEKVASLPYRFMAPVRGWVLNENRSSAQPGGARILDNWIPTPTGVRVRGGAAKYATVHATETVESLFSYKSGSTEKFFAATQSVIADISAIVNPLLVPTPAVTGRTAGYYATEQFGTAGGDYLYAVNGADSALLYNGTTWTAITGASSPAITGATTSDFSHVWSYGSRLFFVKKNSMIAYYLPTDSIGGAVAEFSLAGVFKNGGSLLFGARWSVDAGDGLDDKCVFVSTEGEVAVYSGTNPGSAADWSKEGVYQITKPMGKNATTTAGGDLLIATEAGVVPLSEAVKRDIAALELGAISRNIAPYWQSQAVALSALPWEIIKVPGDDIMVVSQPDADDTYGTALVANLQTGAWSRIKGWKTRCMGVFGGDGYFGGNNSCVYRMETSGSDDGAIYTCTLIQQHEDMGQPAVQKTALAMRPVFQTAQLINPKVEALSDYDETVTAPPSAVLDSLSGVWDESLWDVAVWANSEPVVSSAQWVSVGATGYVIAPMVQLTFGGTQTPKTTLVAIDTAFHVGALIA